MDGTVSAGPSPDAASGLTSTIAVGGTRGGRLTGGKGILASAFPTIGDETFVESLPEKFEHCPQITI
jgi:hypothetical protein